MKHVYVALSISMEDLCWRPLSVSASYIVARRAAEQAMVDDCDGRGIVGCVWYTAGSNAQYHGLDVFRMASSYYASDGRA